MQKDISPEERLLALIKGKGKKAADSATGQSDLKKTRLEMPTKREGHFYLSKIFKLSLFKNKVFEPLVLKTINKYLIVISIVLIVYLIFDLFFIKPYKKTQSLISQTYDSRVDSRQAKKESISEAEVKDYSYYSKEISNKKIFAPPSKEDREPSQPSKAEEDISSKLTLVGIIAGENPQAIIEDKKSQKTYYLNKGQSFNGFTVEDISDGKVVLDYEGKKTTLFL